MDEVIVRVINLPAWKTGAAVVEDENGDYNIYVNARFGYNGQIKALEHEYRHIRHNDFHNSIPIELCEQYANGSDGDSA